MKRPLFYRCLILSTALHVGALWVFYLQPVILRPKAPNLFGHGGSAEAIPLSEEDINLSEKNIALEEVFNQIVVLSSQIHKPYDFEQEISAEAPTPLKESVEVPKISDPSLPKSQNVENPILSTPTLSFSSNLVEQPLSAEVQLSPVLPPLSIDKTPAPTFILELQHASALTPTHDPSTSTFPHLDIHYPAIAEEPGVKKTPLEGGIDLPPLAIAAPEALVLVSPDELLKSTPSFTQEPVPSSFLGHPTKGFPKSKARGSLPSFNYYALPEGGAPVEWNDEFDVEVCTLEQKEEGGYIFSLSFKPKYDMRKLAMKQNFYFLIDRSNSIERHRFQTFKRAVSKALTSLKEGDSFNIIFFDTKASRLSQAPLPASSKNIHIAEDFLENQKHQNLFSAVDIYDCLTKLFPSDLPEDEMNTAILISDGDSLAAADKHRKQINTWLAKNSGRIHLHTACVGQGNNTTLLDLLSHASHGKMLYSDTHASFPRKLAKMVIDLRFPLAKEMMASIVKGDPDLQLFPSSFYLPALYSNAPFVVYGSCKTPSNFTLLIQGRHKNQWLNIKKEISFLKAKPNTRALEKEWAVQKAHLLYEEYLKEGKISSLQQAEKLQSR